VKTPDCITSNNKDLIIRWGEFSSKSTMITYYEMTTDGKISLAIQEDKNSVPKLQTVGRIPSETYCKLLKQTKENIMKVQALNVPGNRSNFVEYIIKSSNYHFQALWNPDHDNVGNKEFKALFAELQAAVREASK
jgi:hypothetical protein